MKEVDFRECKFIEEAMKYYTYYDFCKDRNTIKRLYKVLTDDGKQFYKWFVYANINMEIKFKNAIWDFLNDDDPDGIILLYLKKFYKVIDK